MKKFTSLLIGCSLALAGAAAAQQPDPQPTPKKNPVADKGHGHAAQAKSGMNPAKGQSIAAKPHGVTNAPVVSKVPKVQKAPKPVPAANVESKVAGQPATDGTPGEKQPHKGIKAPAVSAKAPPSAAPAKAVTHAIPAATAAAVAAPPVSAVSQPKALANAKAAAKKPDPQQVQQIKAQHTSFHAQPKPQQVPAVTFTQNYRIQGSDQWQGRQYEAFRSYHPERHDEHWYRSRYNRVELIGGGYYYWNNNYWYPAWGYSSSAEYYPYDGPIYVGHRAEPPDRVIADVQATLQQMGYYRGEVDGLLGPLTREALTAYQSEQGLMPTAAIDEPTLDALGMG